jgi:hypothetical protein
MKLFFIFLYGIFSMCNSLCTINNNIPCIEFKIKLGFNGLNTIIGNSPIWINAIIISNSYFLNISIENIKMESVAVSSIQLRSSFDIKRDLTSVNYNYLMNIAIPLIGQYQSFLSNPLLLYNILNNLLITSIQNNKFTQYLLQYINSIPLLGVITFNIVTPVKYPMILTGITSANFTDSPTEFPSNQPSNKPSDTPSNKPSDTPSNKPSNQPSNQPSDKPSNQPSDKPSNQPSTQPINVPSTQPSDQPSTQPSDQPSTQPSNKPTYSPSNHPSDQPSTQPSDQPSTQPSNMPTFQPSISNPRMISNSPIIKNTTSNSTTINKNKDFIENNNNIFIIFSVMILIIIIGVVYALVLITNKKMNIHHLSSIKINNSKLDNILSNYKSNKTITHTKQKLKIMPSIIDTNDDIF